MKETLLTVLENTRLAEGIYRLRLTGDTSAITAPGQFVNLKLSEFYLRRPISVCDWTEGELTLSYKVLGHGTEAMTRMTPGAELNVLTGLGNGFDVHNAAQRPLAKRLTAQGKRVTAVLGFNRETEIFLAEEFRALGVEVIIATADGSAGLKGLVTDGMAAVSDYTYLYTCGPEPMLKAVYGVCRTSGQFSFEERMGCGFGACMGCSCRTKYGNKRICKEGPVLEKEEIVW